MKTNTKKWLVLLGASALLGACGGDGGDKKDARSADDEAICGTAEATTENECNCLKALADPKAKVEGEVCSAAVAGDKIALLAQIKLLAKDVNQLLSLAGNLSPAFQPAASQDVKTILESALGDMIKHLEGVEEAGNKVVPLAYEEASLVVNKFPIELDLSIADMGDVTIDLKGEWTRVPYSVATLGSSGALALINFLLAHEFKLDLATFTGMELSSSGIAGAVAANPNLLSFDDGSQANWDAISTHAIAMMALLEGSDSLLALADEQIAKDDDQTNNLVGLIDQGDGKFGKGDTIEIASLTKAVNDVGVETITDDKELQESLKTAGTITNKYISRGTFEDAVKLAGDVYKNLKGDGTKIPLTSYLGNGRTDLQAYLDQEKIDVTVPEIKNWVQLNPKALLDADGLGLRDYLPIIYAAAVTADGDGAMWYVGQNKKAFNKNGEPLDVEDSPKEVTWEVAFECEFKYTAAEWAVTGAVDGNVVDTVNTDNTVDVSLWRYLCGSIASDDDEVVRKRLTGNVGTKFIGFDTDTADMGHFGGFVGTVTDAEYGILTTAAISLPMNSNAYVLAAGFTADAGFTGGIAADNVAPAETDLDGLLYIGMQNPGFSKGLEVDPAGAGSYAVATQATFNATLGNILKTIVPAIQKAIE